MRLHRRKRMPRKTKEQKELENENKIEKKAKKTTAEKKKVATSTTKKTTTKKETTSKTPSKKTIATKNTTKKVATTKSTPKEATTKKATSTKTTPSKTTKKVASTKNTSNSKKTTAKTTTRKTTSSKKKVEIVEYYDLPYRYNQTIVKVLAQTPTNLFIYWDISDKDRKNFKKQYGDKFFETTRPILIIHNDTLGYHFEVEINDFANSWYLHVADSKCDYRIELGRRPITKTETLNTDYIYITTSNEIESPNDRILFDKNQQMVYFRDTKTGKQTEKQISSISLIRNMGKIYNIYDLYQAIYPNENIEEIFDLSNPSSGNPSSGSLSSSRLNRN